MDYTKIAPTEVLELTKTALEAANMQVSVVDTAAEAKKLVQKTIPEGSSVMQMTSKTLDDAGISELINESGKYDAVKPKLYSAIDENLTARDKKNLAFSADFAVGSAHAVTMQGELIIASNTGSQLGAYVYGAGKVIFVIGTHKLVKDLNEGISRINEYVLPLESERARVAYGVSGSNVSKLLIISKEVEPDRIHVVLVKEALGF